MLGLRVQSVRGGGMTSCIHQISADQCAECGRVYPLPAHVAIVGWWGATRPRVVLLAETPKRYRARVVDAYRTGNRTHRSGDIVLVPKHAVVFGPIVGAP